MKKRLVYIVMVSMLLLVGCNTDDKPNNLPTNIQPPSKAAADCAADGPGCEQFNPKL